MYRRRVANREHAILTIVDVQNRSCDPEGDSWDAIAQRDSKSGYGDPHSAPSVSDFWFASDLGRVIDG